MKQIGVSIPEDIDEIMDDVAHETGLRRSSLNRFAIEEFARDHRFLRHDIIKTEFLKRAVGK